MTRRLFVLTGMAGLIAVAGALAPRGTARRVTGPIVGGYSVEFTVGDNSYLGTGAMSADGATGFTGKIAITTPTTVNAEVKGRVAGDTVSFTATYLDVTQNCKGTMNGQGQLSKDSVSVGGSVSIDDVCRGPTNGTFVWKKAR
jgi:hypothetical protein